MARRRRVYEDDSLSEDVDDISEDPIVPPAKKRNPVIEKPSPELPWIDKFEPKSTDEVCINPRKLKEVREALASMLSAGLDTRLLILSGPSGSSKSALARCIGRDLIRLRTQQQYPSHSGQSFIVEYFDSYVEDTRQVSHFQDFMDGCKYRVGQNLAMILIEELPNIFHEETLSAFRKCLRDWIHTSSPLPPVVLCLTEVELTDLGSRGYYNIDNILTVETLLGKDLLNSGLASGSINRIKFLPVAKTYLKKTLTKVVQTEKIKRGPDFDAFFEGLLESGDIRALINNLELWARSPRLVLSFRESRITLFHAVGRVLHSSKKLEEHALDDFDEDYWSVQSVLEQYGNFSLLHLALLENYHICNGLDYSLETAANIVDALSTNDTLHEVDEGNDYGVRVTRAELRTLPQRTSKTHTMKFPRQFKMLREANKVQRDVRDYCKHIAQLRVLFLDVNLIDGCLLPRIYNSFHYKMKFGRSRYSYNRIGGSFQHIYADENLPVMENEGEVAPGVRDQFHEDIAAQIKLEDEGEDEEVLSEAIESDTDEDLDSTLDDALWRQTGDDDLLDDPELDMLVSQGML